MVHVSGNLDHPCLFPVLDSDPGRGLHPYTGGHLRPVPVVTRPDQITGSSPYSVRFSRIPDRCTYLESLTLGYSVWEGV